MDETYKKYFPGYRLDGDIVKKQVVRAFMDLVEGTIASPIEDYWRMNNPKDFECYLDEEDFGYWITERNKFLASRPDDDTWSYVDYPED